MEGEEDRRMEGEEEGEDGGEEEGEDGGRGRRGGWRERKIGGMEARGR